MENIKNNKFIRTIYAVLAIGFCLAGAFSPSHTGADYANATNSLYIAKIIAGYPKDIKEIPVKVTAYSSTVGQTDSTPFITASGKYVVDGIVANNSLPFGTKIKIPSLYGDKIFIVEDRMNKNASKFHIDIWMPSTNSAITFGVKTANIEILD